jgi:hypothetical protein
MTHERDAERILAGYLAGHAPRPPRGEDCPPVDALVGLVEERLLPGERPGVEAHVAGCDACRSILAALAAEGAGPERSGVRALRPAVLGALAAAAVLLAAGLWALHAARPRSTAAALASARADLARSHPDLFGSFQLLGPGDRPASPVERERGPGTIVLLEPVGRVLAPAPRFRWRGVPGARAYELTLYAPDGTRLLAATVPAPADEGGTVGHDPGGDAPAPPPGQRCLWKVSAATPRGDVDARARFEIAGDAEREQWARALRAIEARVPEPLRALLTAQVALRRGLLDEAERAARRYGSLAPDDAVGRETLLAVLAALGREGDGG